MPLKQSFFLVVLSLLLTTFVATNNAWAESPDVIVDAPNSEYKLEGHASDAFKKIKFWAPDRVWGALLTFSGAIKDYCEELSEKNEQDCTPNTARELKDEKHSTGIYLPTTWDWIHYDGDEVGIWFDENAPPPCTCE